MDAPVTEQKLLDAEADVPTFVLTQLEVYNWGPFVGRHCAEIELEGTAVIGPTGSGKTTLVDALMTLLTQNPKYNLASTGGHESDRDLISYVRGVSGPGSKSDNTDHISRPGKTISGICARFSNGEKMLTLAGVFWIDDNSVSTADLQKLWIFSDGEARDLGAWLETRHTGGARALKQLGRETQGLRVTANKQEYLSYVRRFFEVSENAFNLLNRASGMKQLDSIDDIFRELVLDDSSAFERAAEVAKEFDDLTSIHSELETARQQQRSLEPVASGWMQREQHEAQLAVQKTLKNLLPIWYAEHAYQLWGTRLEELEDRVGEHQRVLNRLNQEIALVVSETAQLRDHYMQSGGASIEQLQELLTAQERTTEQRRRHATEYGLVISRLNLNTAITAEAVRENQARALQLGKEEGERLIHQRQEVWNLGTVEHGLAGELKALQQEEEQVKTRPGSNIPGPYQLFRSELAAHLQVDDANLPFVGELVELKAEESVWRGAVERALGGNRVRIMVSPELIQDALSWVNGRDNRLHVRLLEAEISTRAAEFLADGFSRKLKFKPHAHREAAKRLLASIDRHCVRSTNELYATPYAMTVQGLMSGKNGFFDKHDQQPLDKDWMTGFDNQDRLAELARRISGASAAFRQAQGAHERAKSLAEVTSQRLALLGHLAKVVFSDIDLPGAEAELAILNARILALSDPDSDAQVARVRWQASEAALAGARKRAEQTSIDRALFEKESETARVTQERAFARIGAGLTDELRVLASQHLPLPFEQRLSDLGDLEREAAEEVQGRIETLLAELASCEKSLVRAMEKAQKIDTGALAEVGTEMQDVPEYLERLRVLTEEALPEKLNRFLTYLNQSSDQGVTQLLTDIDNEVSMIEERIEDLNRTLRRVDFQPERYLQLEPQRIVHESLRTLQQAQRNLRSAALKEDQGESHFKALRAMVDLLREASERKKILGARALLDPRYRLQFAVSMIHRGTGTVVETRTGSQGGSGGEKESIASYVLTASLSYALCPPGSRWPLFGTIVVDEAFSKSSQAVAGRFIGALSEFGLHPLFVTPNKELQLLRQHTRSAILIHRKGQLATMTSLSWEEIAVHARERKTKANEVPG